MIRALTNHDKTQINLETALVVIVSVTVCLLAFTSTSDTAAESLSFEANERIQDPVREDPSNPAPRPIPVAGMAVEQKSQGSRPSAQLVESFDGLGFGFEGPQGKANLRNPSDNTIAVGPDHIVQIVNSRMAVFTKKG
jgi:hypothetical protein